MKSSLNFGNQMQLHSKRRLLILASETQKTAIDNLDALKSEALIVYIAIYISYKK